MNGPTSVPKLKAPADRVYIQLGRMGDAIASAPLCWLYWKETGKKCALMVHRSFSSFLEGISYIIPVIWDGDWQDAHAAAKHARGLGYRQIVIAQIYGYNIIQQHTTSSFILESWKQVGRLQDWDKQRLVFDRRNLEREAELAKKMPTDKPVVLLAADGISSPFPNKPALVAAIKEAIGDDAHLVDLCDYRTPHFHDFLGLFDRAACLVTCDTGFGQLACASKIPVCALAAYRPTTWHSAPRRKNHVCYIRYNEFDAKRHEFIRSVKQCVNRLEKPKITHVWAGIGMSGELLRRHEIAKQTWIREGDCYMNWVDLTCPEFARSAKDIGDPVALPFIHDMMNYGLQESSRDHDILLITNADISMVNGLGSEIAAACTNYGSCYCHRWDFPLVVTHITREQITQGSHWYVGCDLFACTVKWWREHQHELPPFVLGRECWDWVFRVLINQTGGKEIEKGIYHEKHPSHWEIQRNLKGNIHNRSHARKWLQARKIPLAEITNLPFIEV